MSAPHRPISRGKVVRWPAILLLAAAVVAMTIVSGDDDDGSATAAVDRPVVPTAGEASSLSSTWYCAAGTIIQDGFADHELIIANPSPSAADVRLTVFPVLAPAPIQIDLGDNDVSGELVLNPPEAVALDQVGVSLEVPPYTVRRARVAELEGVAGEHAAVLVEADVGNMVVEHVLTGPSGVGAAPCGSTSAGAAYFAAGTTRKGAREVLSIFNPFPGDAVVDITFTTDAGPRTPQIYDGLVIPSGTILPVDITDVVTLFDQVSAAIDVRIGRVISDRLLVVDGSEGPGGVSVAVGAPQPADAWVFASSAPEGAVDAITIHNPSTTDEASVDVEIFLDLPEFNGRVEPVGLTIRPGRTETVALTPGAELVSSGRVVDASARIPDDVGYWAAVRSLNGVDIVADHLTIATTPEPVAVSASPGAPVAATRHYAATLTGQGELVVVNPAEDRIAVLDVTVYRDEQVFSVASLEVSRLSRLVLDLAALGVPPDAVLEIVSTEPVFAERRAPAGDAGSVTMQTVVAAGTTSTPELPLS